jgi:hypothetical protein
LATFCLLLFATGSFIFDIRRCQGRISQKAD